MTPRLVKFARISTASLISAFIPAAVLAQQTVFANPLSKKGDALSLAQLVGQLVRGLLGVSAALAVVFIISGGVRVIFAAGNEDQVSQGKQTLLWAIVGLIVAFGGFMVIGALVDRLPLLLNQ